MISHKEGEIKTSSKDGGPNLSDVIYEQVLRGNHKIKWVELVVMVQTTLLLDDLLYK